MLRRGLMRAWVPYCGAALVVFLAACSGEEAAEPRAERPDGELVAVLEALAHRIQGVGQADENMRRATGHPWSNPEASITARVTGGRLEVARFASEGIRAAAEREAAARGPGRPDAAVGCGTLLVTLWDYDSPERLFRHVIVVDQVLRSETTPCDGDSTALTSSTTTSTSTSTSTTTTTTTRPVPDYEISFDLCEEEFGGLTAGGSIRNNELRTVSYELTVDFTDRNGNRLDRASTFLPDVAPHEVVGWSVLGFTEFNFSGGACEMFDVLVLR